MKKATPVNPTRMMDLYMAHYISQTQGKTFKQSLEFVQELKKAKTKLSKDYLLLIEQNTNRVMGRDLP